ncbi:MAG: hypothetical protein EBR91_09590 [Flavobacteriia bacterium]|nr:hypothetical protein [Flavobacteriia bacterium]
MSPISNIGSFIVTTVESTVVVVPETRKSPNTCTFFITTFPVPLGVIFISSLFAVVARLIDLADVIFKPPLLAVNEIASLPVPVLDNTKLESVTPVTEIVKSCALPFVFNVKLDGALFAFKLSEPPVELIPPKPDDNTNPVVLAPLPILIVLGTKPVPILIS